MSSTDASKLSGLTTQSCPTLGDYNLSMINRSN